MIQDQDKERVRMAATQSTAQSDVADTVEKLTDVDPAEAMRLVEDAGDFLLDSVFTVATALQLTTLAVTFAIASVAAKPLRRRLIGLVTRKVRGYRLKRFGAAVANLLMPILWLALLSALMAALSALAHDTTLLRVVTTLVSAWIVIRLFSGLVPDTFWARVVAIAAWSLAALSIVGWLGPAIDLLDGIGFSIGEARLTLLLAIKGVVIGGVLLWAAFALSSLLQRRLEHAPHLTPSLRVLITQITRFTLLLFATLIALNTIGIDFTALAVFSGALGVGLGFGLQKVVSNFVSGIILLLDRSIEPGDVLEISGTYGRVTTLGARYTSVVTRDGTEYLIPNEQFITEQVVNWAYSDTRVRRRVPIGISYSSDMELARRLVVEACAETSRVIDNPKPVCHLVGFGDNAVDLEARFWIADPENGVINVTSDMLRAVWRKFHENGIEFPFPQRDVHLKQGGPVEIVMRKGQAPG